MTSFSCVLHHLLPGYCRSLDTFPPKPYSDQDFSGWSSPPPSLPAAENISFLRYKVSIWTTITYTFFPGISSSSLSYSWENDNLEVTPSLRDLLPCFFCIILGSLIGKTSFSYTESIAAPNTELPHLLIQICRVFIFSTLETISFKLCSTVYFYFSSVR